MPSVGNDDLRPTDSRCTPAAAGIPYIRQLSDVARLPPETCRSSSRCGIRLLTRTCRVLRGALVRYVGELGRAVVGGPRAVHSWYHAYSPQHGQTCGTRTVSVAEYFVDL
jgi:hypothetical protein